MFKKMILLLLLFLPGCFKESLIDGDSVLVVGTNAGFVPYEFVDEKGRVVGFDIDVAQAIANKMGKRLIVKNMPFDALILSLKQEKIDLVIAGLSITKEKLNELAMIHYHGDGETEFPLVFWKKIPDNIKSINDLKNLKNKTVSVQVGNIQEEFISKFDFLDIKPLSEISDLIMDIKYGKSIACVVENLVVKNLKKTFSELCVLNIPLNSEDIDFGHGIAIKKGNEDLTKKINDIVGELKMDGSIKKIERSWF
ncbi:transporter substrate-binding domain-containing protein [Candidatus Dependentiae bacterium]